VSVNAAGADGGDNESDVPVISGNGQVVAFRSHATNLVTGVSGLDGNFSDIYARNLPPNEWNARWWKYASEFQGIEPPSPRGEEWCDAATKTHINDNPAYYYNYAFATVFKFQLHDYIARHILHQPPQSCNYANNKEVGAWLNNILKKGGTEDWRKVLKEATGEDISTRAMMEYFKPLMGWLEEQNKGRQIGWD